MIVELIRQITEDCGEDVLDFPEYLAPLLQLGIYNDTRNLIFANSRDEESYFYISESVSSDEFSALVEYQVPKSFFLNSAASVTNAVTRDGCLVTNIGVIPPRQADDLAMIADRRIQQGDLTLVVVWGLIFSPEGNFVRFCARNDDLTSPLGDFLKECFGSGTGAKLMPGGQGSGGGVVNLDLGLFGSFIGLEKSDEKLIAYIKECMELVIFGSK
jgi:nanoRNase/pAp phosphatase (c-di-AMP/oligoRNAs hydrolase)